MGWVGCWFWSGLQMATITNLVRPLSSLQSNKQVAIWNDAKMMPVTHKLSLWSKQNGAKRFECLAKLTNEFIFSFHKAMYSTMQPQGEDQFSLCPHERLQPITFLTNYGWITEVLCLKICVVSLSLIKQINIHNIQNSLTINVTFKSRFHIRVQLKLNCNWIKNGSYGYCQQITTSDFITNFNVSCANSRPHRNVSANLILRWQMWANLRSKKIQLQLIQF